MRIDTLKTEANDLRKEVKDLRGKHLALFPMDMTNTLFLSIPLMNN